MVSAVADKRKGVDFFLEIAKRVLMARPEANFIWMGSAPSAKELAVLQETAMKPELRGQVVFTGNVEDPRPLMARAEAVLLTSRSEGAPKVLLEANALGRPSVAFGVDGVPEVTGPGSIVVPPGDVEAFTRVLIERQYDDNDEARARRVTFFEATFTPEAFAGRFAEALAWWESLGK